MDEDKLMERIELENFNLNHLVEEFPDKLTGDYLLTYKSLFEKRLNVVTKKLSELILSRQPTYVDELQRIADLQKSITESIRVCTQGRSCLRFMKDGAAKNGSVIVEHHRKRESLIKLLDSLTAISDLRRSVLEIREIIDIDEDFPRAIQMCKDVKAILVSFEKYKCVAGLDLKLNETLEFIGEQMDSMLSKMCLSYSPGTYAKLQQSYIMMDRNINAQALKFFRAYHKSSMDELKMFLENEVWEVVPVKSDFKLVQLKEFSFLRTVISAQQQPVKLTQCQHKISHYDYTNEPELVFEEDEFKHDLAIGIATTKQLESVIPLEHRVNENDTEEELFGARKRADSSLPLDKISLSSESDENLDSELNKDFVEEDEFISSEEEENGPIPKANNNNNNPQSSSIPAAQQQTSRFSLTRTTGPVLTNSSLNVLRLFGKYIQMMSVLEPIAYEILMGIYNLLDQYTMIVYKRFSPEATTSATASATTSDKKSSDDKNISPKLKVVIRSIRESLIGSGQSSSIPREESSNNAQGVGDTTTTNLTVQQGVPNITSIINQDLATNLNNKGDEPVNPKKAVAVESLIFLVKQLWNLQEYLESLIPAELRPQLREQFSQNHSVVPDFLKACAEMNTNIQYNNTS